MQDRHAVQNIPGSMRPQLVTKPDPWRSHGKHPHEVDLQGLLACLGTGGAARAQQVTPLQEFQEFQFLEATGSRLSWAVCRHIETTLSYIYMEHGAWVLFQTKTKLSLKDFFSYFN